MEFKTFFDGRLIVETCDITKKTVDAVVNAANSTLLGGGGVDGSIHKKGGNSILEECRKIRKEKYPNGLPTGEAVCTNAGNLPAKYVIHTVGPVWYGGNRGESVLLKNSYLNSLAIARELQLNTIAFPAISTGVYGYPKEEAAVIVYSTIAQYFTENRIPEKVFLVFFNEIDANIFLENVP